MRFKVKMLVHDSTPKLQGRFEVVYVCGNGWPKPKPFGGYEDLVV